ncbi:MAG: NrfD/PsrC family molybdoenzyme membrane anchor subunit [Planctomycetota bacterium]|jgi:molybdopterin-containing oxidoreductase family membrane subunit
MSVSEMLLTPSDLAITEVPLQQLDDDVYRPMESFPTARWWMAISFTGALATLFAVCVVYTVMNGIGTWGNNVPVGWGWAIVNFVFWIGIGHAGTLISAILYLLRQQWRTGISRFAEAMTIFAVFCAMQFPLIHTGRPWLAMFWLLPYPNDQGVYQNFRSPLEWDVFAVATYGLVSFMFWYTGLIPDLAGARDRAKNRLRKLIYGLLSLGWQGSGRAWHHYEKAYLLFAGLSTPLVLSVHSIVSLDFAVSVVPGWHTTIFPPYFVAGAVFSGFAMVCVLIIIMRKMFRLQHLITDHHLEVMNKITIATSMMVGYAYAIELFMAWYSGMIYERYAFLNRALGPYAWAYWIMLTCNVVVPQLLWFRKIRRSALLMYPIVVLIIVGMWFERLVIVVTSLHRDFLPSSWDYFKPTWVDVGLMAGSFGVFLTLMLLFCRFLPTIAVAELKAVLPKSQPSHGAKHG